MQGNGTMRTSDAFRRYILAGGAALALCATLGTAHARGFSVLYSFTGGSDGEFPDAGLIKDAAGNVYGTTENGGANDLGTVFKIAPDGTETVLYSFTGSDGIYPEAGLIKDAAGNLYGTTLLGGQICDCGVVFRLAPDGTETVLRSFGGTGDGRDPAAGLIKDKTGNLFGTTDFGGSAGEGTVFKLAPDGTETMLWSFGGTGDGIYPEAGLIKDAAGNLYGTTLDGGVNDNGIVFKLTPRGAETVLHSFTGSDGSNPAAGLIADAAGNLYGTTEFGGANNGGVVFKVAPDGTETVLHSFADNGSDGYYPMDGLIKDETGNLYGTTYSGGAKHHGIVFKLAPDGTETVLHAFSRGRGGGRPTAGLIRDAAGNLYGTTSSGGVGPCNKGCGTVFKLQ